MVFTNHKEKEYVLKSRLLLKKRMTPLHGGRFSINTSLWLCRGTAAAPAARRDKQGTALTWLVASGTTEVILVTSAAVSVTSGHVPNSREESGASEGARCASSCPTELPAGAVRTLQDPSSYTAWLPRTAMDGVRG